MYEVWNAHATATTRGNEPKTQQRDHLLLLILYCMIRRFWGAFAGEGGGETRSFWKTPPKVKHFAGNVKGRVHVASHMTRKKGTVGQFKQCRDWGRNGAGGGRRQAARDRVARRAFNREISTLSNLPFL